MNKQEFNIRKRVIMDKKPSLIITPNRSNWIDGWDACIKELETISEMTFDNILKQILKDK